MRGRKLKKLPTMTLCFVLALTLMAMTPSGLYTEAMTEYPYYAFCAITGEFIEEDYIIRSTATIDCNFYDDTILVVLTRRTSRQFREISTYDFPELDLYSVTCLTPGVELARSQLTARVSRRASTYYYDASWSINTDYFRIFDGYINLI